MKDLIKDNVYKNIIVIIITLLLTPAIYSNNISITANQSGDYFMIISMLLVTVCFANFAFTYEKSNMKLITWRYLAHFTTGLFILLTGLMLESLIFATKTLYPNLYPIITVFSITLYIAIVLFDFWDLQRATV